MALGMMKLNFFTWNQKLKKYVKMGNFGKGDAIFQQNEMQQ